MARKSPVSFTQDIGDSICEQIVEGESLRSICKQSGMPSIGAFLRWVSENDALKEQYARAKQEQAETFFDEIIDIADHSDKENVACARLQVDARKWVLGKLKPKKYGDKLDLNHSGKVEVTEVKRTIID